MEYPPPEILQQADDWNKISLKPNIKEGQHYILVGAKVW
jgi:hypothetical protein